MRTDRIRQIGWKAKGMVGLLSAGFAALAHAGPPFVTDDPDPVSRGSWEINYGMTANHTAGTTSGFLPSIDINYGAASGVQLHAQPQVAYTRGGDGHAYGVGDTELGIKYRFTPESDNPRDWMIGTYPMLELPTGDAAGGLGAGAHSIYVPIWFQTTRGRWTAFGGGGYWFNYGEGSKNAWAGGWTMLYQVLKDLQLGGEIFAATPNTVDGSSSSGVNLGGVYQLGERCSLLFSAGQGIKNAASTNQGSAYFGLRVTY